MASLIIPQLPQSLPPVAAPQPFTPEWLNGLGEAERKSPEVQAFALQMHNSGAEYVTWLFWRYHSRVMQTPLLPRQGSVCFVDCGRGPFAVTAGHVYEQFVADRVQYRIRGCQIGNVGFNPEERLIARGTHQGLDIATFRVTPEEIAATGKKILRGNDGAWPQPPAIGSAVFLGGFPGCERDQVGPHEMVFGLYSAMPMLTSFTDHQLCCQFDRNHWVDVRGLGLPLVGYDLGGASGGPMLAPVFEDGAWGWRLLGIISEARSTEGFERATAVRAHFIQPDGNLRLW